MPLSNVKILYKNPRPPLLSIYYPKLCIYKGNSQVQVNL